MAPAIVHFLVGAAILLAFAAPFVFRYTPEGDVAMWLVAVGGIWGLVPDFHHVAPVAQEWLYAKHTATWVDLFALHYTLDRPLVRAMYLESVFAAIVVFLVAVTIFAGSSSIELRGGTYTADEQRLASLFAFVVATGYAGFVTGIVLSAIGHLEVVSVLVGGGGLVIAGISLVPLSVLGGLLVYSFLRVLLPVQYRNLPFAGGVVGVPLGFGIWLVVGVFVVPLWLRYVDGVSVSVPLFHWSLAAVLVFTVTFGLLFATVRGAFESTAEYWY